MLGATLGVDDDGREVKVDLIETTHLCIVGPPGSGKSTAVHCILRDLLLHSYEHWRLILVDDGGLEGLAYRGLPHLMTPPADRSRADAVVRWVVAESGRRLDVLDLTGQLEDPPLVLAIDGLSGPLDPEMDEALVTIARRGRRAKVHLLMAAYPQSSPVAVQLISDFALLDFDRTQSGVTPGRGRLSSGLPRVHQVVNVRQIEMHEIDHQVRLWIDHPAAEAADKDVD